MKFLSGLIDLCWHQKTLPWSHGWRAVRAVHEWATDGSWEPETWWGWMGGDQKTCDIWRELTGDDSAE